MGKLFTSESVTEGHPDKIADQISDAILDAIIKEDPDARVAAETTVATGLALIVGEITTKAYVNIPEVVRQTIREIGYTSQAGGYDADSIAVLTSIDEQSVDIALGVDNALETKKSELSEDYGTGAGDQGMVFGYATNETPEYMPPAITYAHRLSRQLSEVRKNGTLDYLRPDGKTQVTIEMDDNGTIYRIDTIVISVHHSANVTQEQIRDDLIRHVIFPVIPSKLIDDNTKYYINPTGRFVIGGPQGDSGLTGRKIIVDTYGGSARHGGGAFSGKDPTKVDRSAAYAARWVAKNLVAAGVADKLEIEIAYAIGVAKPVSISVDTFGTGKINEKRIVEIIEKVFDLRPSAIIDVLNLKQPIYRQTAAYGHFGRTDIDLPWEKLNKIEEINKNLFLARLHDEFIKLVDEYQLRKAEVKVKAALLSPEDSIGATKRQDYVLLTGKERLLQATVMGCKGQAFTGSQGDFSGTLEDVLALPLIDDFQRAIYIATLNAVVCYTGKDEQTVHCRNEGPEQCALQTAAYFKKNYGDSKVLMIGYQPALAEAIHNAGISLIVLDLDPANIGETKNGVLIRNGVEGLEGYISNSDVIFATGSTICNATIDALYNTSKPLVLFGTTGAGAAALLGIKRFCPESTRGR